MAEPKKHKDLELLAPIFRYAFEAWLNEAQATIRHIEFRVNETRRYADRQAWLWRQGREAPYLDKPIVTWTKESLHQWGLAADWFFVRLNQDGVPIENAVWEADSYRWIYRTVPPGPYGLRTIEGDYCHLEYVLAKEAIAKADELGLYRA